jgi:hypothetical protein
LIACAHRWPNCAGPLQELRGLRDPRSAMLRHLFADDAGVVAAPIAKSTTDPDVATTTTHPGSVPVIDRDAT